MVHNGSDRKYHSVTTDSSLGPLDTVISNRRPTSHCGNVGSAAVDLGDLSGDPEPALGPVLGTRVVPRTPSRHRRWASRAVVGHVDPVLSSRSPTETVTPGPPCSIALPKRFSYSQTVGRCRPRRSSNGSRRPHTVALRLVAVRDDFVASDICGDRRACHSDIDSLSGSLRTSSAMSCMWSDSR